MAVKLSPGSKRDASSTAVADTRLERLCAWCEQPIAVGSRADSIFCSKKCRQAAWRIHKRLTIEAGDRKPKKFAYADPPYPGNAAKFYGKQSSFRGEVDHKRLIASLMATYDGWALSTSAKALRSILPLCPRNARVCVWAKPVGAGPLTYGIHNCWEPLIVVPGRALRPGKRDWLMAQPARRGGSLMGRKPEAFCCWLFELLGMQPGDVLDDLFPGTGIVTRAWKAVCRSNVA